MEIKDLYKQEQNARKQLEEIRRQIMTYKTFNLDDCLGTVCTLIEKIESSGSWVVEKNDDYDAVTYQICSTTDFNDFCVMTVGIDAARENGLEKRIAFEWLLSPVGITCEQALWCCDEFYDDKVIYFIGITDDIADRPYIKEFIDFLFNYRLEHQLLEITKQQMEDILNLYLVQYKEQQKQKRYGFREG